MLSTFSGKACHPKPVGSKSQNTLWSLNGQWLVPKTLKMVGKFVPMFSEEPINQLVAWSCQMLVEIEVQLGFPLTIDESRL